MVRATVESHHAGAGLDGQKQQQQQQQQLQTIDGKKQQGIMDGEVVGTLEASSFLPLSSTVTSSSTISTFCFEAIFLLNLAIPTVLIQLGFVIPPFLTASYVGLQLGPVYLDGFQLANLTGNLFTLSLLRGLLSASDTLSPQAYGAGNYREIGLLAMRGFLGCIMLILPICALLCFVLQQSLVLFGEDPAAAYQASRWYAVYACSLPPYAFFMVIWKFLSAQNVMMPLVIVTLISCVIVLPVTLHVLTMYWGFLGSAMAIVFYQCAQAILLIALLRIFRLHRRGTWPGLSAWREALQCKAVMTFFYLGLGGMIASSEWIYWETLSLAIGTLGVIPLSVHTVPTQVLTVTYMIPLSVGLGLAVRLGATLPSNVDRAKKLAVATYAVGLIVFGGMAIFMFHCRSFLFAIFTSDDEVLAGCEEIWWKVCMHFFTLSIYAMNSGIATGLGLQWTLGMAAIFFLWIVGLPGAWYFGILEAARLSAVWNWIWPPYMAMNVVLILTFAWLDWNEIGESIRMREKLVTQRYDRLVIKSESSAGASSGDVETAPLVMSQGIAAFYGATTPEEQQRTFLLLEECIRSGSA